MFTQGLGKLYGEMLILCHGDTKVAQGALLHSIEIPGDKPKSYRGKGLVSDRFALAFPNIHFSYVVQEFGVKSTAHSFLALMVENQYHWKNFRGVDDTHQLYLKHPIKQFFFRTYFFENPQWLTWLRETGEKRFTELFSIISNSEFVLNLTCFQFIFQNLATVNFIKQDPAGKIKNPLKRLQGV